MSESANADEPIKINDGPTTASEVDWAALWDEFGFDTPDAAGDQYASDTQLHAAVEASEQGIDGGAESLIQDAVDDGKLRKLEIPATTRGYVLQRGGEQ